MMCGRSIGRFVSSCETRLTIELFGSLEINKIVDPSA